VLNLPIGISFKTQALYVIVFISRYLDLFHTWVSLYNFVMKVFFIGSSIYILYLMKIRFRYVATFSFGSHLLLNDDHTNFHVIRRPTNDPSIDTFRVEYLIGPAFLLGLLFNYSYSITEVFWSFSIFLESVAILPQLFILQRTGEAETITTHYLAALGAYRGLYIPNWLYRCVILGLVAYLSPYRCAVLTRRTRICGAVGISRKNSSTQSRSLQG
jgi:ER lumen protein retaining receptor